MSMPGSGFRHAHASESSCMHTTMSSRGRTERSHSCCASTTPRSISPRATSGWFVTTIKTKPEARSCAHASSTPGSNSSSVIGAPSGNARTSTPSRSRNTARRTAGSETAGSLILDEVEHRGAQRLARAPAASPAEGLDALGVEAHDRDVALPAAGSARESVLGGRGRETEALEREVGDLRDGDVVAGGDVVRQERRVGATVGEEDGIEHVVDVDVRLALAAVAEDVEVTRSREQLPNEVEPDSVGLPGPDNVPEAERASGQLEHRRVRRDQRLARELAGAVGGHRNERTVVFLGLGLAEVAVDDAPRCVE